MFNTPVAFLIFNRPELTGTVFREIARAKPKKLLLVADGPRTPEEAERCERARSVIEDIDWDCEVLSNFSEENLGCKRRISSGLDWVFSEVEEAIILEDDCLPAPSFFHFCEEMLERYRYDERIMHISGDNFQGGQSRTHYSYYFSRYVHVWGWASWRRAWKHYDVDMKTWPELKEMICSLMADPFEKAYWLDVLGRVHAGSIDTWDYQWLYACWSQSGLSIIPNANLISNIGFSSDATHTHEENHHAARLPVSDIWEIIHPQFVVKQRQADDYTFDKLLGGKQLKEAALSAADLKQRKKSARSLIGRVLTRFTDV